MKRFILSLSITILLTGLLTISQLPLLANTQAIGDTIIVGNISIRVNQGGNVVLIVDNGVAGTPDGSPDLVIRFAPKKVSMKHKGISFDLQDAKLFLSDRRVAVVGSQGHTWVSLSLEPIKRNDEAFALYGDKSADLPRTIRITKGYALQRQTVHRLDDGSTPAIDLEQPIIVRQARRVSLQDEDEDDEEQGDGMPCTAGGRGATSCSYSCGGQSCSVNCGSGAYACCGCRSNIPYCYCKMNLSDS